MLKKKGRETKKEQRKKNKKKKKPENVPPYIKAEKQRKKMKQRCLVFKILIGKISVNLKQYTVNL